MGIFSIPTQNALQKTLDATLTAGGTSLTLNEDVSSLFSGVSSDNPGVCVIDRVDSSGNATPSKREYVKFTGMSTTNLTGLTRNVDGSGSDQEHAVGAIVEFVPDVDTFGSIKDTFETEHNANGTHAAITATSVNIGSTIAITGVLDEDTMSSDSAVKLATQQSIKAYVDTEVSGVSGTSITLTASPASDHSATGVKVALTANENQAFGDVGYINSSGKVQLGDADAIANAKIVAMCIDSSISADASGTYLLMGIARDDTWSWTVGGFVYLSTTGTTGNTLTQTAPSGTDDAVVVVGIATHADRLYFNPSLSIVEHV